MDSRAIATALEAAHPSPSLHLDSPVLPRLERLLRSCMIALEPIYLVRVPKVILNDASVPYWRETRAQAVGMASLDEYERAHADLGPRWEEAAPALRGVTELLGEAEGPFFLGGTVSYADFVWGGFLIFMGRLGEDVLEEVLKRSGGREKHQALLEGLEPWVKRAGE
jgi:glutathione S-transferase